MLYSYSLDGKESVNLVEGENIATTAKWEGNALVIEWKDQGGTLTRRFTFSDNGKTLTVDTHDSSAEGKTTDMIVLERQ